MISAKTILLNEDDVDLREALARQFTLHEAFRVEQAATASEGIAKAETARPDVIILDVDLPDMDGRDACRLLRKRKIHVPILMLTGQTGEVDTILGLDAGANDYIAKPIKFPVLLARVRAHLRTHEHADDVSLQTGPYEFRPSSKLLVDESQRKIRLTEKEAGILLQLDRAAGKPVLREELLAVVWGRDSEATLHTLETHVYRLRQKIEPNPAVLRYLITESGSYRLQT